MEGHSTVAREDVKTWTIDVDDREYEAHPATPTYEGTTGLFHMPTAYTLPKGRFSFSLFRDNLDRDPKDEDISIHGLSLGYGISSRFELYGNFGLQNRIDADALFQPGFVNDYPFVSTPWETGVGDLKLGAKFGFLDDYMGDAVGLAVRGFVKIPTADEAEGPGHRQDVVGRRPRRVQEHRREARHPRVARLREERRPRRASRSATRSAGRSA